MPQIVPYDMLDWVIPTETGGEQPGSGRGPLFKEESPPSPVTLLQAWAKWSNVTGGDATSKGQVEIYFNGPFYGTSVQSKGYIGEVASGVTTTQLFDLFTLAAPSDGSKLLRFGNFNESDARLLRVYAEFFSIKVLNAGVAYTGGLVQIVPVGWIL